MELIKRKAEGNLVLIRAIKGAQPQEQDDGSTVVQFMYVDNNYDPQRTTCSVEVLRVVENKRTSKSTGVPITRMANVRMLLERKENVVKAVHVVPVVDALYLASRKDAEGVTLSEDYELKIDKDTGSIIVTEAPGISSQKEVEALVRALAKEEKLDVNDVVDGSWLITQIKGNKCTVTHT